jgi:hypothetical protein
MAARTPTKPPPSHTPIEDRAMRFVVSATVLALALTAALGSALS